MKRPPAETPALYSQDGEGYDAIVYAHYFLGSNDWLITEYDPESDIGFGWARLNGDRQNAELGYVSLAELEGIRAIARIHVEGKPAGNLPLPVEYDEHWTPVSLMSAVHQLDQQAGFEE